MERILALDVGNKRIGVAVSDPLGVTAQGVTVIKRSKLQSDLQAVCDLITKYGAEKVVVGLPLNLNGTDGPQADVARRFAVALKQASGVEIVFQDERLSTVAAERALLQGDTSRKRRKQVIDMLAAQMILDVYLSRKKNREFSEQESGEN